MAHAFCKGHFPNGNRCSNIIYFNAEKLLECNETGKIDKSELYCSLHKEENTPRKKKRRNTSVTLGSHNYLIRLPTDIIEQLLKSLPGLESDKLCRTLKEFSIVGNRPSLWKFFYTREFSIKLPESHGSIRDLYRERKRRLNTNMALKYACRAHLEVFIKRYFTFWIKNYLNDPTAYPSVFSIQYWQFAYHDIREDDIIPGKVNRDIVPVLCKMASNILDCSGVKEKDMPQYLDSMINDILLEIKGGKSNLTSK
jgi:hypothetical protein